jgi:DNA ligase-1
MRYELLALAYRDLEDTTARSEVVNRLARLIRKPPAGLLPRVVFLCQGRIAPQFSGVELGLAERRPAGASGIARTGDEFGG